MFKKRISIFGCVVISLFLCAVTFVATFSRMNIIMKNKLSNMADTSDTVSVDISKQYDKLEEMLKMIELGFVKDYSEDELWEAVYYALAQGLDDAYSTYMTADEYDALTDDSDGDFVGIGVHVVYDVDTEGSYIFGVMPDSPAEKAGVLAGDIIVAVEGDELNEETYTDCINNVIGAPGTDVNITLLRGEERIDVTITRASVKSDNVRYVKLDGGIAYIRIFGFADMTVADEFKRTIAEAQEDGCTKFIYDVRNNGGGYLDQICETLDLLLPEGPIINIVDKHGNTTSRDSDADHITGKAVVLCNDATASAAELFTKALMDYEIAVSVGQTTFGKGTMQVTKLLSDGSALKLSSYYYNPPSNVSYDGIGIEPDHKVELDEYWEQRFFKMPIEEDAQLQYAISLLEE